MAECTGRAVKLTLRRHERADKFREVRFKGFNNFFRLLNLYAGMIVGVFAYGFCLFIRRQILKEQM